MSVDAATAQNGRTLQSRQDSEQERQLESAGRFQALSDQIQQGRALPPSATTELYGVSAPKVRIAPGTEGAQSLDAALNRLNTRVGYPNVTDFGRKVDLGTTLTLQEILRKQEQTQMPSSPQVGAGILGEQLQKLLAQCRGGNKACGDATVLKASLGSLETGIAASPGCGSAADSYLNYYPRRRAPVAVRAAYDLACLGAFEPRARAVGFSADAPPAIFASGAQSAHAAVGLLEIDGSPVCGGLLRNDRTFVTARHCFEGVAAQAWKDGRLRVRPADGRAQPWAVANSYERVGALTSAAVGHDWAIVRLATTDTIGAPATELRMEPAVGEVTLLGYFKDHTAASYGPTTSAEDWRRGLRWPRAGFCQAYREEDPDCVKLLCQTVEGFSGTPVFLAAPPAAGQPYQVVGFISRPSLSSDAACGAEETYITAAVAARAARP